MAVAIGGVALPPAIGPHQVDQSLDAVGLPEVFDGRVAYHIVDSRVVGPLGRDGSSRGAVPRNRGPQPGSRSASSDAVRRRRAARREPGSQSPAGTRCRWILGERRGWPFPAPRAQWANRATQSRTSPTRRGPALRWRFPTTCRPFEIARSQPDPDTQPCPGTRSHWSTFLVSVLLDGAAPRPGLSVGVHTIGE